MPWKHTIQNAQMPTICHQSQTLKYISSHRKCTVCTVYKPPSKAILVLTAAESLGAAETFYLSVVGNVPYRAPLCRVCEHLLIPLCSARAGWLRGNHADQDYGQEARTSVGPHTVWRGQQPFIPPLQSGAQHVTMRPTERGRDSCFYPTFTLRPYACVCFLITWPVYSWISKEIAWNKTPSGNRPGWCKMHGNYVWANTISELDWTN